MCFIIYIYIYIYIYTRIYKIFRENSLLVLTDDCTAPICLFLVPMELSWWEEGFGRLLCQSEVIWGRTRSKRLPFLNKPPWTTFRGAIYCKFNFYIKKKSYSLFTRNFQDYSTYDANWIEIYNLSVILLFKTMGLLFSLNCKGWLADMCQHASNWPAAQLILTEHANAVQEGMCQQSQGGYSNFLKFLKNSKINLKYGKLILPITTKNSKQNII